MLVATKDSITSGLLEGDKRVTGWCVDSVDEEFLSAFCELLELEDGRNSEPIIVLPDGPAVVH